MTIKSRLLLGIAFLLAIVVVIGFVGTFHISSIAKGSEEVYDKNFVRLVHVEGLIRELNELSVILLAESDTLSDETILQFNVYRSHAVSQLRANNLSATEQFLLNDLDENLKELTEILKHSRAGGAVKESVAAITKINLVLHTLFTQNEEEIGKAMSKSREKSDSATTQVTIIGAVCLLISLLTFYFLPRLITQPFAEFTDSIRKIAKGDYGTRLPENREDEFGRLNKEFNLMIKRVGDASAHSLAQVSRSRNQLDTLVNQLDEMILGIDKDRVVTFINKAMEAYLGLEAEQALGNYMPDLALSSPRLQQLFEPLALGKEKAIEPFQVEQLDGSIGYFQERVLRPRSENGDYDGYIIILSDVTDYEERTKRQTDFLATLSHEMKTPIAAITMCLNLLEDERLGKIDPDQLELTNTIRKNSKRLLQMVNEVLQLAQNDAGSIQLNLDSIDLRRLGRDVITSLQPLLKEKDIRISHTSEEQLPRIEADLGKIKFVVKNLFTNAIRYSPISGKIALDMIVIPGGVRITVADHGPGVAAEEVSAIFEKYRRASNDNTKGTGLGLTIAREFMEAHGGRVYLDEDYSSGAKFVVELPRKLPESIREKYAITAA